MPPTTASASPKFSRENRFLGNRLGANQRNVILKLLALSRKEVIQWRKNNFESTWPGR
jgi:hypothetical protein